MQVRVQIRKSINTKLTSTLWGTKNKKFTKQLKIPKAGGVWVNPLYTARLESRPRPLPPLCAAARRVATKVGEVRSRPTAAATSLTVPTLLLAPPPPPAPLLAAREHPQRLALLSHMRLYGGGPFNPI